MPEDSHYRANDQTVKMLYWLIPYLVVYNASDTGDWKYGPEHVFKVEVRANAIFEDVKMHSNVNMEILCKPINSSLVQCRIENPTIDNYVSSSNITDPSRAENYEIFEIGNVVFQIEFDVIGVMKISLLNARGYFRENMIRAIIDNLSVGIDLRDKKFGNYVSVDKSVNGICDTSFDVRTFFPNEEKKLTLIEGYEFDVVPLSRLMEREHVVIAKQRIMKNCVKKTPYVFGSDKKDLKTLMDVTSSRSKIYLGRNSFSSYTETAVTAEMKFRSSITGVEELKQIKTGVLIRLSLESIRPAREEFYV